MRILSKVTILAMGLILSSCALVPGGDVYLSDADRKVSEETQSITPEQIEFHKITASNTKGGKVKKRQPHRNAKLEGQKRAYSYKIGAGDTLQVTVWEHPELLNLGKVGLPAIGFLVDSQGFIFYPYIGRQQVAGKSLFAVRTQLSTALSKYIEDPQLDVTVSNYVSKKIYLTGELAKPAPIIMRGQAITLLDAISQAGGVTQRADMNDIVVVRKGKRRHIDLYALTHYGDMRQNILMVNGDQIHVASTKSKNVYLMGQVGTPVTVAIEPVGLTLAEALGRARGLNEASADASAVYVIRESHIAGKVAKIHQLDLRNMAAMVLASKFDLKNEDIIYVAKSPIVKWNQLLSVISPSLEIPGQIASAKAGIANTFK